MNNTRGFTLVELLVYIVSMTVVLAALTYFIMQVYGLYSSITAESRADRAASAVAQVLSTEIRSGVSIDQASSVFGSGNGMLTINAQEGETAIVKSFAIAGGQLRFTDGGSVVMLTPEDMTVSKLLFMQLVTPVSYAVRYEFDLTFNAGGEIITKTYPGLVILRHSYE